MNDTQKEIVKLRELNFIASEIGVGESTVYEKVKQEISNKFAQINKEIAIFFAKIYPQTLNVICSINKLISQKGNALLFRNQAVKGRTLTYSDCFDICKQAIREFPNTVTAMVRALKTNNSAAIEVLSQELCCEYNTVLEFKNNVEKLQEALIAYTLTHQQNEIERIVEHYDNFSEEITIPIGKIDSQEVSIALKSTCPDAHVVIAGMSGSGKSSLLQSIILGGAFKYSPDQLQFLILDFKDGTGLIQFKALKHVKVMSVKNRPIDANEIMDYIKSEYQRRAELISSIGGGDIRNYNQWAKDENKPLMPRLLIIIDEFAIMHRSCFAILNEIARLGRSMGIGFILSSQIIEMGAAYGDAVQQANHLFEFKNSDNAFGRLVKNVAEEERKFACSGVIGNCIYRRDTSKTMFRVAYAGDVDEQNEFIKVINNKWGNYTYREPIITGRPERKIKKASLIKVDSNAIKTDFKANRKILIPIGESRMGTPYLYKIDRDNQVLVAFGDESRISSIELSIIEHFKVLSETEKSVYYVDLNCNPDRQLNLVTAKYVENTDEVFCADTDDGAKKVIDRVYKIMMTRRQVARNDRTKDIGNPIELIIHNAERICELKVEKNNLKSGTVKRNRFLDNSITDDMDLADILSIQSKESINVSEDENDIGSLKKLRDIIENGKNSRIYVMLYFEEKSQFQNMVSDLFSSNYDFKDVIIVPKIPDEYEEFSYSEVIDSLTACRLREQASIFDQTKLSQSDFICAVLVDDKVPHKIIPYEWKF